MEGAHQTMKTAVGINLDVFREPRGVMRILQFVFSICAFATTTGFTNSMKFIVECEGNITKTAEVDLKFAYPFRLEEIHEMQSEKCHIGHPLYLIGNFSSDAQFFVATGVLSFLYCLVIVIIYITLSDMYQSNALLPLTDFIMTVILSVFWLSGSGAWANGLNGLKRATDPERYRQEICVPDGAYCKAITRGDYSGLDISVTLGFLNFFLWASDLWFLYKETPWFKMKQTTDGVGVTA